MRVGIATDHGGFILKEELLVQLRAAGHDVVDFGAHELNPLDDYPDIIVPLALAVAAGDVTRGIAICGSGVGASVCANKVPGVRAGLVHDHFFEGAVNRLGKALEESASGSGKTVSGWAMIRLSRHWDHQRENKIQNSRSQRRKQGHEFHCAGARRFDGAGRSIPTAARCGFAVRCARAAALRLSASPSRQPTARRSNPPTNSRGLSFEKDR